MYDERQSVIMIRYRVPHEKSKKRKMKRKWKNREDFGLESRMRFTESVNVTLSHVFKDTFLLAADSSVSLLLLIKHI